MFGNRLDLISTVHVLSSVNLLTSFKRRLSAVALIPLKSSIMGLSKCEAWDNSHHHSSGTAGKDKEKTARSSSRTTLVY